MNVAEHIEKIRQAIDAAGGDRQQTEFVSTRFAAVRESLNTLEDALERLQEVVVLSEVTADDLDMTPAMMLWESLGTDRRVAEVGPLVSASPTLAILKRAGIDVTSFWRYGRDRQDIAALIGTSVGDFPQYVKQLLPPPARNGAPEARSDAFFIKPEAVDAVERLLRGLETRNVCHNFRLQGQLQGREGKRYWRDKGKMRPGDEPLRWRVFRGTIAPELHDFLRGHWLTAFAYGISYDQFKRAERPFEILSNVSYRLPSDMGGGSSDIDVLVRTADQVLMIECKSGPVTKVHSNQPSAADKARQNAGRIDDVLTDMGVDLRRSHLLVHLGHEADRDLEAVLTKGGPPVTALEPRHLRAYVNRLANGTI